MLQLNIKQISQSYIIYRWWKNEKEDGKKHTIFKGQTEKKYSQIQYVNKKASDSGLQGIKN
jgi:hypothetical protein